MTPGIIKGKNMRLTFQGKELYHATSCELDLQLKTEDIATKDTDGDVSTPSGYNWSISTNALVANKPVGSTQSDSFDIVQLLLDQTEIDVEFLTGVTGDKKYAGKCWVTGAKVSAQVGSAVSGSFSFKGNGNITASVIV